MSMTISINLNDPTQAYKAFGEVWKQVKNMLMAGRKQVLTITDFDDALTTKQRGYYHGYILTTIAKQTNVDGRNYPMHVWKEHFRATYLGDEIVSEINPITGIETKRAVRISSEKLGVKGYNQLIEQVTAFAVTELNVIFDKDFEQWCEEQAERFA